MKSTHRETVGFATSIPVEVLFAAGCIPVDLNNIFITSDNPLHYVRASEEEGYPRNSCSWIKGIYGIARAQGIKKVIVVREGECSHNEKLGELFHRAGVTTIPFSYPHTQNVDRLRAEIESLMRVFAVSWDEVLRAKEHLDHIRAKIQRIDQASFQQKIVSSFENYYWQISASDCTSDKEAFEKKLDAFLSELTTRIPGAYDQHMRLGLIGIPPIVSNLFQVIESLGGIVLFNEMPRQFSMVHYAKGLVEQYRMFTYPYALQLRIDDIKAEYEKRNLQGLVHYVQSFCPRHVDDAILRRELDVPMVTIECDTPGVLDERNVTRLEAFCERIRQ